MDTIPSKAVSPRKNRIAIAAALSIVAGGLMAAAVFIANNQPWGYVAPPAFNNANFKQGGAVAYVPWFEDATYRGDLLAMNIDQNTGAVALLAPNWSASDQVDTQDFDSERRIVTLNKNDNAIPFR